MACKPSLLSVSSNEATPPPVSMLYPPRFPNNRQDQVCLGSGAKSDDDAPNIKSPEQTTAQGQSAGVLFAALWIWLQGALPNVLALFLDALTVASL